MNELRHNCKGIVADSDRYMTNLKLYCRMLISRLHDLSASANLFKTPLFVCDHNRENTPLVNFKDVILIYLRLLSCYSWQFRTDWHGILITPSFFMLIHQQDKSLLMNSIQNWPQLVSYSFHNLNIVNFNCFYLKQW